MIKTIETVSVVEDDTTRALGAVVLIDKWLEELGPRELVSSIEFTDKLLDLRVTLTNRIEIAA